MTDESMNTKDSTIEDKTQELYSSLEVHEGKVLVGNLVKSRGYFQTLFEDERVQQLALAAQRSIVNHEKFIAFLEDSYRNGAIHAWENTPAVGLNPAIRRADASPAVNIAVRTAEERTAFVRNILRHAVGPSDTFDLAASAGFRYPAWKDSVVELLARDHHDCFVVVAQELETRQPHRSRAWRASYGSNPLNYTSAATNAQEVSVDGVFYTFELEKSYVKVIDALCDRERDIHDWHGGGAASIARVVEDLNHQFVSVYQHDGEVRNLLGTVWVDGTQNDHDISKCTLVYYDEMSVQEGINVFKPLRLALLNYVGGIARGSGYRGVLWDPDELIRMNAERLEKRVVQV